MKKLRHSRAFVARDVYSRWQRLVASAQHSITIYSPYFDKLLPFLLKANKYLDPDKISVITDFTAESILDMPGQLRTVKKVLSEGISVLTLPGLHAKILLIDDKYVSVGSQNFTCRGRRNKEASATPFDSLEGSRFIATLLEWRKQAQNIEEDFVDALFSKLRRHLKQHREFHEKCQTEIDEIKETYEHDQQQAMKRRLEELERQSHIRMANGVIYANVQNMPDNTEFGDWYPTLLSDAGHDMTNWTIRKANGTTKPYKLSRLSMYPVIIADTLRMGFARIGKGRITYIRNGLQWSERSLNVGDLTLEVEISFPDTKTKKRNIIVKLSHSYCGSCEFALLFTGDSVKIIRRRYFKGRQNWQEEHKEFTSMLEKDFFRSPIALNHFFERFFTDFTYSKLGRDYKNIKDYLKDRRYRLSVIQYQSNPFLVIAKQG